MKRRWMVALSAFAALALPGLAATPLSAQNARVESALMALRFPPGATVRASTRQGDSLSVDFSPETAVGLTDESLEALADAIRSAYRDTDGITNWRFTCNGRPLSSYLPPVPSVSPPSGPQVLPAPVAGPLTGKVIVLSPGHGWTASGTSWGLQRGYWSGIVEDFLNPEMIQYVYNILVNNGATVYTTREMDKSYGTCTTNFTFAATARSIPNKPWWQMAALYNAVRQGAPSSVYDNGRATDANRDIAVRPLYANWRAADIMISLHNNGGGGTGTETLYDNHNGYSSLDSANQYGSQYLAQKVQGHVISQIRANYNSNWADRHAQGFAGDYGENNFFKGPACLIEVAFMDKPSPDNDALHDENYKMLVAKGIYEGVCDYFHVTPAYNTTVSAPAGTWTPQPLTKSWAVKLGSPVNSAPSSSGGWVYAGTDAGVVYGVAATPASGRQTGAIAWKYPTSGSLGAAVRARPTVFNDVVFAVAVNGKMVALDRLSGDLKWIATVPNGGNMICSPAPTSDGLLLVGSDNGRLYSYSQANGVLLKTFPATFGAINAQVAVPDYGHVWVTSHDGTVRCLSGDLTTVLWQQSFNAAVDSAPFVLTTNNTVFITTAGKTAFGLNASNGAVAPGWPAGGAAFGTNIGTSPWADALSGVVAFAMDNHTIWAVGTDSGGALPDFPLRPAGVKEFTSSPVVLNGTIYIGGTDGRFYALKRSSGATNPGNTWRAYTSETEALPGQFTAAPCLTGSATGDLVVAGNTNGWLYAFPK